MNRKASELCEYVDEFLLISPLNLNKCILLHEMK